MRQLLLAGEHAAKGHALLQHTGIGAAAGRHALARAVGSLVVRIQQRHDQFAVRRHMMRVLLLIHGDFHAFQCRAHRGGQCGVVAQDRIADVQRGVQPVLLIVAQDTQVAGKAAAGLIHAADAQTQPVIFHAHLIGQRTQRTGYAQCAQHQEQLSDGVAGRFGIGRVAGHTRRGEQRQAILHLRLHLNVHIARQMVDPAAQGLIALHQRGGDAGNHVAALAHADFLYAQAV